MSQNKSPVSPSGSKPQYSASLKSSLKGKQTNKTNRAGPIFACFHLRGTFVTALVPAQRFIADFIIQIIM